MSNGMKVGIVAIVIIFLGAWYANKDSAQAPLDNTGSSEQVGGGQQYSSTSDDSLDKDLASIDASLKAFDADSANADASLSDKPVTQGE
ncbi:MAG: hypothetical protein V4674_03290 [Patescibacteria group bacterium]